MPDRIIRDELAKSDPWLNLRRNTHRLAFVICILQADDRANFEAGEGALWRIWRDPLGLTDRQAVPEIMTALTDADMVRLYQDGGKRYGHIPKFRQRLRYIKGKHPRPPSNIEDKEISELLGKSQTTVRPKSDLSQTTVRPQSVEVKRSEVKRSEENLKPPARDLPLIVADLTAKLTGNPNPNPGGLKDTKPEKPEGVKSNVNQNWKVPSRDDHQSLDRFAKDAGINPQAFPSYASLQKHLIDLVRIANAEERRHDRQRPIAEAAAQLAHVEVKKEDEAL